MPQNMAGNVRTCPLNIQWSESTSSRPFGNFVEALDPQIYTTFIGKLTFSILSKIIGLQSYSVIQSWLQNDE